MISFIILDFIVNLKAVFIHFHIILSTIIEAYIHLEVYWIDFIYQCTLNFILHSFINIITTMYFFLIQFFIYFQKYSHLF